jgi:hypothetical protein
MAKDPPAHLQPATIEHMADRWAQYKLAKGNNAIEYETWVKYYESNMTKALKANQIVKDYHKTLTWGQTEKSIKIGNQTRRLDIAEEIVAGGKGRGIEVKAYETGVVYATEFIKNEVKLDKILVNQREWEIEWVFKGCTASKPLETLLNNANIKITLIP